MIWKWIGAIFIVAGCGTIGFLMAWNSRREEQLLRDLRNSLELMSCELQYRRTPLPDLLKLAAGNEKSSVEQALVQL